MSWGEVFKINNNMKKALNEQLRDLKFQEIKIITSSGTYTPTKTGLYKVICVGAGGDGYINKVTDTSDVFSGGGGGVSISTLTLSSSISYTVTVSSTASFVYSDEITLTAVAGGSNAGGTASGGDNNYSGSDGEITTSDLVYLQPGSVGVFISELSQTPSAVVTLRDKISGAYSIVQCIPYGDCILNYGGGGNAIKSIAPSNGYPSKAVVTGKPAAIIIVPLELEE